MQWSKVCRRKHKLLANSVGPQALQPLRTSLWNRARIHLICRFVLCLQHLRWDYNCRSGRQSIPNHTACRWLPPHTSTQHQTWQHFSKCQLRPFVSESFGFPPVLGVLATMVGVLLCLDAAFPCLPPPAPPFPPSLPRPPPFLLASCGLESEHCKRSLLPSGSFARELAGAVDMSQRDLTVCCGGQRVQTATLRAWYASMRSAWQT